MKRFFALLTIASVAVAGIVYVLSSAAVAVADLGSKGAF